MFVQVTIETTGTMLVGTDIAAAATSSTRSTSPVMGLNCATGPREMAEHLASGQNWPGKISVMPNAGLPELVDGKTRYPLGPHELAGWLERFVDRGRRQHGRRLLRHHPGAHPGARPDAPPAGRGGNRPRPKPRALGAPASSPRSTAPSPCGRKMPICRSASAPTPTARRRSASTRRPATGMPASRSAASRSARARTRSMSARPTSAATRAAT